MSAADRVRLFVLVILALTLMRPAQVAAQAGAIGRVISGEGRAIGTAARAGARLEGRALAASDEMLAGLSAAERRAMADADVEFIRRSPLATIMQDLDSLPLAAQLLRREGGNARSLAPFDELPGLRIKLASNPRFDTIIERWAKARLTPMLQQRIDPERLKVVMLGMADDAAISAREVERASALIGRSRIDRFGPLASPAQWANGSVDDMAQMLRPYRGTTVVLVGHLPERSPQFFTFAAGGRRATIDLDRLTEAAELAGVNLIPLGCRSGNVGRIGFAANVNSDLLARRLRDVLASDPKTHSQFLARMTGGDMEMLVDALNVRLFADGFSLLNRRTGTELARLMPRTMEPFRKHRIELRFDGCFARASAEAFGACTASIAREEVRLTDAERNRIAAEHRRTGLAALPKRLSEARRDLGVAHDAWARFALLYGIAIIPVWLYFCHVMTGAGWAEAEGEPFRRWFSRDYVMFTIRSPGLLVDTVTDNWRLILLLIGSIAFVIIPFFASADGLWNAMYLGAGIGLSISFVLSAISQRVQFPLLAIPAVLIASAMAGPFAMQGGAVEQRRADIAGVLRDREDLLSDAPHAQWRQVWEWELYENPFGIT